MATNFEKLSISPEFAGMLTALISYDEALGKFADALRLAYGCTQGEEMFNDTFCSFIPGEEAIKKAIADWLQMRVNDYSINSL